MLQNEANEQRIQKTVEEILRRKEFQQTSDENPIADMIRQVWESILEWVKGLFKNRQPRQDIQFQPDLFSENMQNILKTVLIVLVAVILFFLLRFILKKVYLPRKTRKIKIPKAHDYLENPDFALEKMRNLMAKKAFTEAMRFLFVAVLLVFHERKTIRIEKWKTNRAYIREIASNDKEMANPMQELSVIFNACCYGSRTVDEACMNTWFDFYMSLRERPV